LPYRQFLWNPYVGEIDASAIDGQDVIINLAGKNVAAERWNDRVKREIIESRVLATELIGKTIAKVAAKPRLLLNASAIGIYGNRLPEEIITEESSAGDGFMAESCVKWEQATRFAADTGIRVVKLRIGVVLAANGGSLDRMLPFFRLGLGGKLGSGEQMMSWIALEEIGPIIDFIIKQPTISGAVNLTAPQPVTNSEFTQALGKALHRPALLPVPSLALKIALGQIAGEVLLGGANIIPRKLLDSGYRFQHSDLMQTLSALRAKK
jgi:uncharacterized protein (TIGR01777 family)